MPYFYSNPFLAMSIWVKYTDCILCKGVRPPHHQNKKGALSAGAAEYVNNTSAEG